MPIRVYLANRYSHRLAMVSLAQQLESLGNTVVSSTWIAGRHDGLPPRECAVIDINDLDHSDIMVLFCGESRRAGKYWEAGYMMGQGKSVIAVNGDDDLAPVFTRHPMVSIVRPPWDAEHLHDLCGKLSQ